MLEKILNFFGLTTLKRFNNMYETMRGNVDHYKLEKLEWFNRYRKLFNWELNKPEIDFQEYEKKVGRKKEGWGFDNELFSEWYDKHRRDEYMAFKVRQLCQHPHLLKVFMLAFSNFDWKSAQEHMVKLDWHWKGGGKDRVPSIDEVKMHIFTLISTDHLDRDGGVSSGGYELALWNDEEKGDSCRITFKDSNGYNLTTVVSENDSIVDIKK
jgi:hypothetical protein